MSVVETKSAPCSCERPSIQQETQDNNFGSLLDRTPGVNETEERVEWSRGAPWGRGVDEALVMFSKTNLLSTVVDVRTSTGQSGVFPSTVERLKNHSKAQSPGVFLSTAERLDSDVNCTLTVSIFLKRGRLPAAAKDGRIYRIILTRLIIRRYEYPQPVRAITDLAAGVLWDWAVILNHIGRSSTPYHRSGVGSLRKTAIYRKTTMRAILPSLVSPQLIHFSRQRSLAWDRSHL
ncbi:hypothetical protein FB451DRAFT_1363307 [Mycena latifolia]|nr:hypothetical protein FB451DRAFT_1363307 [Mycena latifolia]